MKSALDQLTARELETIEAMEQRAEKLGTTVYDMIDRDHKNLTKGVDTNANN